MNSARSSETRAKQNCTCTDTCARRGRPFPAEWSWRCQGFPYVPTELDMREREQESLIRPSNERFIYCSQTATRCMIGRCVETGICGLIADGRCTSSAEILARAREMNIALRVAPETRGDAIYENMEQLVTDSARYRFLRQPGNVINVRCETAEQLDAAVDKAAAIDRFAKKHEQRK